MWAGGPPQYTDVSQYTEGTLILDCVDSKVQKLVFRGIATGTVGDPKSNAAKSKEAVEKKSWRIIRVRTAVNNKPIFLDQPAQVFS